MSGSAVSSSFRKRPISSSLAIGSTCERPVRKQTIEETLEPRPAPRRQQRRGRCPGRAPRPRPRARARACRGAAGRSRAGSSCSMIRSSSSRRATASRAHARRRALVAIAAGAPHSSRACASPAASSAPGIAVAEVAAEIEAQPLGQPHRLRHRLGMLGKASRHRRRRGEHVAEVAAPLGLRGIERRVQAHRHERVLERRPHARVRVHVAGGHARHAQAAAPARTAAGCGRDRRAGTVAGARSAAGRGRTHRAAAAASNSSCTPRSAQPLRQTSPSAWSRTSLERRRTPARVGPASSRVCACARVRIRHRFDQPRASSTSSVRWRPSSRSISAPWIGRSPSARAETANSIEPETELWSVSASAS